MKKLGNASLAATLFAAFSAVGCADDPAPAQHPVVVRVDAATSAECPDGGSVVRSGVDLDDDGELDDGEVVESSVLCGDEPAAAVVRVDPEPAGANCAEGGSAVHSGLDDDGDGALADGEIDVTDYLCDGEPLTPAPTPALARVEDEPAGTHCAEGGSAVHSGLDDNGDGVLADAEIDATTYLCADELLTRMEAAAAGACAGTGITFHVGLDDDGDGVLEAAEVGWSQTECSDVVTRDVTVTSAADLALLQGVRVINGSLDIAGLPATSIRLPSLEMVGGDVRIAGNAGLATLSLAALAHIGGDLVISNNDALTTLGGLDGLRRVDGDVSIDGNATLASLRILLDHEVGGFTIDDNAALATADVTIAPMSWFSTGDLVAVTDNPALTSLRFAIHDAAGIEVRRNAALANLTLKIGQVAGFLEIKDSPALTNVTLQPWSLEEYQSIGWLLISAPIATLVTDTVLGVNQLVLENTELTRLDPLLWLDVGSATVRHNPRLVAFDIERLGSRLVVEDNDALHSLDVGASPQLDADIRIVGNAALTRIDGLERTVRMTGDLEVYGNALLAQLSLQRLERLIGDLEVSGNSSLQSYGLGDLRTVDGNVLLAGSGLATWSGLPELETVRGDLTITGHPALLDLDLPKLRSTSRIIIKENPVLPVCQIHALLAHVTGAAQQSGNDDNGVCPAP